VIESSTFVPFIIASAILVLIPGPAVLYIVSTGIGRGRRMALASMLGIETGALFHVAAAAVGLSAVVASSVLAYSMIKYAGAAYLIYLGVKTLREREENNPLRMPGAASARGAFKRGVVVNVLNPKLAIFFVAFLPQFVTPARGPVAGQLVVLGLLFIAVAIVIDGIYAMTSGMIGKLLSRNHRFANVQKKVAGVTYLAGTALLGGSSAAPLADSG
jgi:threonine/homoserine/homoserine lactone efflux protein